MNTPIYHLTSQDEWNQAQSVGQYKASHYDEEGFIHCSYPSQLIQVADSKFRGRHDLVLLRIDREELTCKVIDENLSGGQPLFPHIYGLIPVKAVAAVIPFPCRVDGTFTLPPQLET